MSGFSGMLLAQLQPNSGHSVAGVLVVLVAIFVATKILGEIAQRLRQPAVLGELIAGVLLGGSVLGCASAVPASSDDCGLYAFAIVAGWSTQARASESPDAAAALRSCTEPQRWRMRSPIPSTLLKKSGNWSAIASPLQRVEV